MALLTLTFRCCLPWSCFSCSCPYYVLAFRDPIRPRPYSSLHRQSHLLTRSAPEQVAQRECRALADLSFEGSGKRTPGCHSHVPAQSARHPSQSAGHHAACAKDLTKLSWKRNFQESIPEASHLLMASGRKTKLIQHNSEARRLRGAMSWRVTDLARLPRPPALARSSATTKDWRPAGSPVLATCSTASSNVVLTGCVWVSQRFNLPCSGI